MNEINDCIDTVSLVVILALARALVIIQNSDDNRPMVIVSY